MVLTFSQKDALLDGLAREDSWTAVQTVVQKNIKDEETNTYGEEVTEQAVDSREMVFNFAAWAKTIAKPENNLKSFITFLLSYDVGIDPHIAPSDEDNVPPVFTPWGGSENARGWKKYFSTRFLIEQSPDRLVLSTKQHGRIINCGVLHREMRTSKPSVDSASGDKETLTRIFSTQGRNAKYTALNGPDNERWLCLIVSGRSAHMIQTARSLFYRDMGLPPEEFFVTDCGGDKTLVAVREKSFGAALASPVDKSVQTQVMRDKIFPETSFVADVKKVVTTAIGELLPQENIKRFSDILPYISDNAGKTRLALAGVNKGWLNNLCSQILDDARKVPRKPDAAVLIQDMKKNAAYEFLRDHAGNLSGSSEPAPGTILLKQEKTPPIRIIRPGEEGYIIR